MKRNVTVVLDEATARWVRVAAAERDTSVSRFLGEVLRRERERQEGYVAAKRASLGRRPRRLGPAGAPLPGRAELHERSSAEERR
jgi:hypothetical protein